MKTVKKIRMMVDLCMLILLPVLMAEILTGQEFHEWTGVFMTILFIIHHLLNLNWLKNIGKGSHTPFRSFGIALNLLLLADMLALIVSGIIMSGFVFGWLPISGGMILSRRLHLFASHWGLILMAVHIGMHWSMVVRLGAKLRKNSKSGDILTWLARGLAAAISIFGIYAFVQQNLTNYLFLKSAFVLWDETKPAVVFLAELLAIMGLFIAVGYYGQKQMRGLKGGKEVKSKAAKYLAFLIPVLICIGVIVWMSMGNNSSPVSSWGGSKDGTFDKNQTQSGTQGQQKTAAEEIDDGFIQIAGGDFLMGSPENEALAVSYSGGDSLASDIGEWLEVNEVGK